MEKLVCTKCGMSLERAILLALLVEAGAEVYPSPEKCAPDQEHDFQEKQDEQVETPGKQ